MLSLGNKLSLTTQPIYKFVNEHSVDFDGVDDRIITDADAVAQPTTYSFWCKSSETGQNNGVFGHGSINIGAFHINAFGGDRPILFLESNYYRYWVATDAQDDGEWHHWVVYADTNDITNSKLYIDGVLQNPSATVSSGSTTAYTESLTIGGDRLSGGNSYAGKIDEFAVYDRELTQAEITRMYNTYYSPNRIANGNFAQIGNEEVTNGDFSQEGSEILSQPVDLQTDFSANSGGVIVDADTFTTAGGTLDGIVTSTILTIGKNYKVIVSGDTTSSGFTLGDYSGTGTEYGSGFGTHYFTATHARLWVRQTTSGTTNITSFSIKEIGQDWTIENTWTIGDSVANGNGANGSSEQLIQNNATTIGKIYKVSYEILNYVSGSVFLPNVGSVQSGNGIYTEYITATQTDLKVTGNNFNGSITNISVKEVGQHWDFDTGWSTDGSSALWTAGGSQYAKLTQDTNAIIDSREHRVTFDLVDTNNLGVFVRLNGGSFSSKQSGTGSFSVNLTSGTGSNRLDFEIGGDYATKSLSIDNIVVQELKHDATNLMLNAGDYQSANPLITSTKSMEFDGADDYLTVSDNSSLDFAAGFSVSFWVYPQAADANDRMVCKGVTGTGEWMISFGAGQAVRVYTKDGDNVVKDFTSANTLTLNEWAMVTVVVNRTTNYLQVYKNGGNLSESSASWTSGWSTSAALTMGVNSSLAGDFDGRMTEVGIWNRELTSLEVASLYNQGMPTNLLVNRNNYQSGNPTLFNTKQVDFDGVDDVLNIGNPSVLNFTSDFTISMWIRSNVNTDSYNGLFTKYGGSAGWDLILSAGKVRMALRGTSAIDTGGGSGSDLRDGNWHHIVAVNTNSDIKLYLDGVLIQTQTGTWTPTTTTNDALIGERGGIPNFDGDISQVGVWTGTLTADEVSSLYNHGLPIDLTTDQAAYESSANLTGYWRMGSGTLDNYPSIGYLTYGVIADQTNATLGSEIVVNGDFATDSNWTKQDGWTISGGKAHRDGTGITNTAITQDISVTSGKVYKLSYDRTYISGGGQTNVYSDFVSDGVNETRGSYQDTTQETVTIVSYFSPTYTGTLTLRVYGIGTFTGSFDNVSVKEFGGNPAIMTNMNKSDIENGSPYANFVQNGNFTTDTIWTKTNATIDTNTNKATVTITGGGFSSISQSLSFINGNVYKVTATINGTSGKQIRFQDNGNNTGGLTSVNGLVNMTGSDQNIEFTWTANADSQEIAIARNTGSGDYSYTVSNVTILEVNTGLQGYWKMGDGTNDEYPIIVDQVTPDLSSEHITGFTNGTTYPFTTFTTSGNNITSAIVSSAFAGAVSNAISVTSGQIYKVTFDYTKNSGDDLRVVFSSVVSGAGTQISNSELISASGSYTKYFTITSTTTGYLQMGTGNSGHSLNVSITNVSVKNYQGNPATMTNMLEGNITNQYPLTKIRNYYRMGDGIMDGYPTIQDQTSPNLAHIPTSNVVTNSETPSILQAVTTTTGIADPFGGTNAIRLNETTANSNHYAGFSTPVVSGKNYTVSVFVKKGSYDTIRPYTQSAYLVGNATLNFNDLSVSTNVTAYVETYENGWYRLVWKPTQCTQTGNMLVYVTVKDLSGYAGNTSNYVDVFGVQVEEQNQATAYIKSDGIAAVRKSSTTNIITYSEDFTQSAWTKNDVTITSNSTTAPNSTLTADKITKDGVSANDRIKVNDATISNSTVYNISAYVKNDTVIVGGRTTLAVRISGGTLFRKGYQWNGNTLSFASNFASGTRTNEILENVGNGWYRIGFSFTSDGTVADIELDVDRQNASDTTSLFAWGVQLEQQTQAETYAKTTGLPVTIDLFTENNYGTMTNMSASDIVEDTP